MFLLPHGMIGPMISQRPRESNPFQNPNSRIGAWYIAHNFPYHVRCKSVIPLKLCLSDLASGRQDIESHRLKGKIFRNKELGADRL